MIPEALVDIPWRHRRIAVFFGRLVISAMVVVLGVLPGIVSTAIGLDLGEAGDDVVSHLSASEQIVYDKDKNEISAKRDVVVDRGPLHLSSDTLQLKLSTQTAVADGNVRIVSAEDEFSGSRLEFNWEEETGNFFDGSLFIEMNNFHIQAGKIVKSGRDTYFAEDVFVTTCDEASPAWRIKGKELDITVGGYGKLKHGTLLVKEAPVLYVPFVTFPVKTKRKTGFLTPDVDFSNRMGVLVSQPFFWAIGDSSDATFYLDYMSRRGEKLGAEYRYFLSGDDFGVVMFDYLYDMKVDDGSGTTSKDWGYTRDGYLRPNSERYWFRMKHNQVLGDIALKVDLDIVSDQDYLYDFRDGKSGFGDSESLFLSIFNRELDDYNQKVRKNRIGAYTQWTGYSLNAEAIWWDDIISRTQEDVDDTVQSLPVLSFDGFRQSLPGTPLYVAFETEAAYLYREDGTTGERIDLYPRLYLPYRLGNVLSIEPSIGGRETLWQIDRFGDDTENTRRNRHRELYDFKLDLSSETYKVFRPRWGDIGGLKHVAKFQVEYDYIPTLDQEDYPYFDGMDRIDGENLITYSIVNTVTTRHDETGNDRYRALMRFELSQSFDVNLERDGSSEPFGPVEMDLQLSLGNWGDLRADAALSSYSGVFGTHNISYRFSDNRGDTISIKHRYAESIRETIAVAATLKLSDRLWLFPEYERNIKDDYVVTSGLELIYRGQCWSVATRYREEYENGDMDWHLGFTLTLYGLGDIGNSSQHDDGLPSWAR